MKKISYSRIISAILFLAFMWLATKSFFTQNLYLVWVEIMAAFLIMLGIGTLLDKIEKKK